MDIEEAESIITLIRLLNNGFFCGFVVPIPTSHAGGRGFDSHIRQSYSSALMAFAYETFFGRLSQMTGKP